MCIKQVVFVIESIINYINYLNFLFYLLLLEILISLFIKFYCILLFFNLYLSFIRDYYPEIILILDLKFILLKIIITSFIIEQIFPKTS